MYLNNLISKLKIIVKLKCLPEYLCNNLPRVFKVN